LAFFSCKKAENSNAKTSEKTVTKEIPVNLLATDSINLVDSSKVNENLTAIFRSSVLVFPNLTNKILLDSIYSPLNLKLKEYSKEKISAEIDAQKKEYYDGVKKSLEDWAPDFPQTWEQNSY